ncbi:MAG: NPCBM/NEW2 domain-containing protein [Oscillospiraceae bacterium]|nr:NPCBM/NEW2 domain-containing protein [Oscillospiraceae bacterium]
MRKRMLAALLAISIVIPTFVFAPAVYGAAPAGAETVASPDGAVIANFWINDGTPYYNVVLNGFEVVEPSRLGINTSLGGLFDGFTGYQVTAHAGDAAWTPVVGERETIIDRYNGKIFTLEKGDLRLGVELRAYDQGGAALRYILPEGAGYTVTGEETRFTFASGGTAYIHNGTNQTGQTIRAVTSLGSGTFRRPMTVIYPNGMAITVAEANLDNYAVMNLSPNGTRAVKAGLYSNVTVTGEGPNTSPWRVVVCAGDLTKLPKNADIIANLNEAPDEAAYGFSQWVKPGSAVRATGLNNTFIKNVIDMCAANGHKYVLLDAGWYGQESTLTNDPRLDPAALDMNVASDVAYKNLLGKSGEGYGGTGEGVYRNGSVDVDVPALCAYANERGVGVILYVNGVFFPDDGSGRYRFTADELFAYYEKWGVKGVKPGFVDVNSQKNEANNQYIIEAAARHRLILTLHDEYVTTGTERTFPNCLTVEGIKGDEEASLEVSDDLSFAFTRMIQGPADHTYCYVGKATKAYALASPVIFRSGLHLLYWYTNPELIPAGDVGKHGFWENLPATWKESLYLEARIREYVTYARKSFDNVWYVASLSAVTRELSLPLTFLDDGVLYKAEIFADGADADPSGGRQTGANSSKAGQTLEYTTSLVSSGMTLSRPLRYGFGYAVKLTPATADEIAALPAYRTDIERLRTQIGAAYGLTESLYTPESWAVLASALADAERVLRVPQITETVPAAAAVETARGALQAAVDGLGDIRALREALAKITYFVPEHYTGESWGALAAAVAAGNGLLTGLHAQAEIDAAARAVNDAVAALAVHPNRRPQGMTYLSDETLRLGPGSVTHDGAGENGIRRDVRRDRGGKIQLMVDGAVRTFDRGVSAHAKTQPGIATLIYDIGAYGFHWFQSYLGIDYAKASGGNVKFRIYGDDVLMYESAETGNGSRNAQFVSLPVNGVNVLKIEIDELGSNDSDWADLADANFLIYALDERIFGALEEAVAAAEALTFYEYTPGSWAHLETALNAGRALYDTSAGQPEIDAAAEAIREALGSLEKNPLLEVVHLSDVDYAAKSWSVSAGQTGQIKKDKNRTGNQISLILGGERVYFDKGVVCDAPAELYYDLAGQNFKVFEAYVGVDAEKFDMGSVTFRVYGDGRLLGESRESGMGAAECQFLRVGIEGVRELKLEADMGANRNGDWADWAGAKLIRYEDPAATLHGLWVNGSPLPEFDPNVFHYVYPAEAGGAVPEVTADPVSSAVTVRVFAAREVPGTTVVRATKRDGTYAWYGVSFRAGGGEAAYLSDLAYASCDYLDGTVSRDVSIRNNSPMAVTAADGAAESRFAKGLGGHAVAGRESAVTYDLTGRGYHRFEAYVGIPYGTHEIELGQGYRPPRSSVVFRVYVDGEKRYESGVMNSRTPAQFISLDITGAQTIRLALDAAGNQAADHANWADAKFLTTQPALSGLPFFETDTDAPAARFALANDTGAARAVTCLLAEYDASGRLLGVRTQTAEATADSFLVETIPCAPPADGVSLRAFLWEETEPLAMYAEA